MFNNDAARNVESGNPKVSFYLHAWCLWCLWLPKVSGARCSSAYTPTSRVEESDQVNVSVRCQ